MKELGYYNGKIGELSEMSVPMNDRVCWFGDGVYEAQPCRNRIPFALDEHVDRFFRSASFLEIEPPLSKEALKDLLRDLTKKTDDPDLFVYYQLTRGTAPRAHVFPENAKANLWVTLTPKKIYQGTEPVSVITGEDTRFFHCNIKTLNLIPSVMAAEKAKRAGAFECVFYRPGERVTECAHSNIHILKDGVLQTAPTDNLILPGIARAHLLRACGRLGIPVREEPFHLCDLREADEILITSSSNLLRRVNRVDGTPAGMKDEKRFNALHEDLFREYLACTEAK